MKEEVVKVYIAKIPKDKEIINIYPSSRLKEIEKCASEKIKYEKYYIWRLLIYALCTQYGYSLEDIKKIKFEKLISGKWICDKCKFSLSHSNGVLVCVLSNEDVGVDIETYQKVKDNLALRICNNEEYLEYEKTKYKNKYLIMKWTEKEACFKMKDCKCLDYKSVNTNVYVCLKRIKINDVMYYMTIASSKKQDYDIHYVNDADY